MDRPPIDWDRLAAAARGARDRAHAPYSRYKVGAAVLTASGAVHASGNVEYAIPALSICAERMALSAALAAGDAEPVALAVVTASSPPARPCGLCRQTLAEVATELPILCLNDAGERVETDLAALLPEPFRTDAGAPRRYGEV